MKRIAPWLALAVILLNAGCIQSEKTSGSAGTSGSTGTTSSTEGGSSTAASGASGVGMTATAKSVEATPGTDITTASGLKYQDLVVGTGTEATVGRTVHVHYSGWLTDGTPVDSSVGRQPIAFPLGTPNIIAGWNEGITGMKVGGKRHLTIPSNLGYGAAGRPPVVPPNATLVFDVELVGVD